tara:strand:+ start:31 stop:174 length:144 start_codon:yes stop_codon:yes gene_type:complete
MIFSLFEIEVEKFSGVVYKRLGGDSSTGPPDIGPWTAQLKKYIHKIK